MKRLKGILAATILYLATATTTIEAGEPNKAKTENSTNINSTIITNQTSLDSLINEAVQQYNHQDREDFDLEFSLDIRWDTQESKLAKFFQGYIGKVEFNDTEQRLYIEADVKKANLPLFPYKEYTFSTAQDSAYTQLMRSSRKDSTIWKLEPEKRYRTLTQFKTTTEEEAEIGTNIYNQTLIEAVISYLHRETGSSVPTFIEDRDFKIRLEKILKYKTPHGIVEQVRTDLSDFYEGDSWIQRVDMWTLKIKNSDKQIPFKAEAYLRTPTDFIPNIIATGTLIDIGRLKNDESITEYIE